ncbi:hypothetical protein GPECTOR_3g184 [Gonium pectorale]|uniref:RanBD1 domain-containing protein n=1 Tax=Gonium pectorale TaxID=33097 RepID=A0A150GZ87_GONPE|nr:hypothetical protein GPECTOR_3g184 [Gonium pectorale]|eukprot:KXZ55022.1 hypothetical protein GPECTOR_3g184 [Gonium pectorale]
MRHVGCWVATHKEANLYKFWVEGARDYLQHAQKLLDEYKDVLGDSATALQKTAAAAEELWPSTSGRPAAASFGSGSAGGLFGAAAAQPTVGVPAPATGFMALPASAAPGPASASGPAAAASAAPVLRFGAAPSAGAGASAPVTTGFSFGAAAAAPAAKPAEPKPVAADAGKDGAEGGKDAAAAAGGDKAGGAKPVFAFGAPSSSAAAAAGSEPAAAAAAPRAFTFGAAPAAAPAAGKDSTAAAPAPAFTFGAAPAASAASASASSAAAVAGSIFGATTSGSAPSFSFGAAPATSAAAGGDKADGKDGTAASAPAPAPAFGFFGATGSTAGGSSAGFSFGSSAPAFGSAAPGGFSFGAAPASGAAAGGDGNGDDDDGEAEAEQDECAKEPSLVVDESALEFMFTSKARLLVPVKTDAGTSFESKGMGMLSVRRAKTPGAKPYIALFTDTGRCLFQAYFNKTMKLIVNDARKTVSFSTAWSPDGSSAPTLGPAMFQLGLGKNRAFEEVIKKLQDEMPE